MLVLILRWKVLFGAVRLNKKNILILDTVLDLMCIFFSMSDIGGIVKKIIIFGADMSSTVHLDNLKKDLLILGKG